MAAGLLFRDRSDQILFVEPSYKPNWEIPGGAVEANESPWCTAARELVEELGIDRPTGRLLVVDYVWPQDSRPEGVMFVSDGGVLNENDVARFVPADGEIVSAGFYSLKQVRRLLKPILADRISAAIDAAHKGVTTLCEDGVPIT